MYMYNYVYITKYTRCEWLIPNVMKLLQCFFMRSEEEDFLFHLTDLSN